MALLKIDGTVVAQGNSKYGGSAPFNLNNVEKLFRSKNLLNGHYFYHEPDEPDEPDESTGLIRTILIVTFICLLIIGITAYYLKK